MSILFNEDPSIDPYRLKFSAFFIHQDSYTELLRLCNTYFNLNMLDPDRRELPLPLFTYMLIKKHDASKSREVYSQVGLCSRLTISHLVYSKKFGVLVAKVQLKRNWTVNSVPHIVLAKKSNITNNFINLILDGSLDQLDTNQTVDLYDPISIRGRIGVMSDSKIEDPYVETTMVDGLHVEKTTDYVDRPEVSISIERPPYRRTEAPKIDFTFDGIIQDNHSSEDESDREIQDEKRHSNDNKGLGTYRGFQVKQGPRGGKYYIDGQGKKQYLQGNSTYATKSTASGENATGLVYKINMVNDKKE